MTRQTDSQDPELAEHNLEHADRDIDDDVPPKQDQRQADFAAEAHGFTGFESADKGSEHKTRKTSDDDDDKDDDPNQDTWVNLDR